MKTRVFGPWFWVLLCVLLVLLLQGSLRSVAATDQASSFKKTGSNLDKQAVIEATGMPPEVVDEIFHQTELYDNLTPELILALIKKESNFHPGAIGPKGTIGLGQVMPSIGRWVAGQLGLSDYSTERLYNPIINVKITSFYLSKLISKYAGDHHKALTAYNMGSSNMRQYASRHGTAESSYSRQVLEAREHIIQKYKISVSE